MVTPIKIEFQAIHRNKVYEEVAKQLERRVRDDLKPGDTLPTERELAQMFGVSRGSVRDAIRRLEHMGLLETRQGVGTLVREPSAISAITPLTNVLLQKRKIVAELLEVRKMIEPPLAGRAATHATSDDINQMEEILRRQQEKVRRGQLAIEEDSEFHYRIARAANNQIVLQVVDVLMDLLREIRERSLQANGRREKSYAGHWQILTALKRRNSRLAETAMRRHLQEIEAIVLNSLNSRNGGPDGPVIRGRNHLSRNFSEDPGQKHKPRNCSSGSL